MATRAAILLKSDAHAPAERAAPHDAPAPTALLELEPAALMRLLQLTSAALPIGAFAYSQGLESAVEQGWLKDEAELVRWLSGVGGHSLAGLDLPLLLRMHSAWLAGDTEAAWSFSELLVAQRESRELLEQDEHLGSALSAVLANLGVPGAIRFRARPGVSYAFAYASAAAHFALPPRAMAQGYAFAWLEQQVGAAARLIPLGHMASQRVLSELLRQIPPWVEHASRLPTDQIGALTPALAMASAWHESQYSRLFRS